MRFEIVVIGNDKGAFELTRQAARLGRRVAIVAPEKRHSAWMVQQGIQRLLRITTDSLADRNRLPAIAKRSPPFLLQRLLSRSIHQVQQELLLTLDLAGAVVVSGEPLFLSADTLEVSSGVQPYQTEVTSDRFAVATGVRLQPAAGQDGIANALSLEDVIGRPRIPTTVSLYGKHPLVGDLKSLLRRFDIRVTSFIDAGRRTSVTQSPLWTNYRVARSGQSAFGALSSGDSGIETIVDCRRTVGYTSHLRLAKLGVLPDEHGQLWCSDEFRTWCGSIYGFGDVVGFPELRELTLATAATRLLAFTDSRSDVTPLPGPSWLRTAKVPTSRHGSDNEVMTDA